MAFDGIVKVRILSIESLKLTSISTRYMSSKTPRASLSISPYVSIDVDDVHVGRTTSKHHSGGGGVSTSYHEEFQTDYVTNVRFIHFTVFHKTTMPPDEFVANAGILLCDLRVNPGKWDTFWLELEACGRINVSIELDGSMNEGKFH